MKEFKAFLLRGNIVDLAVAVVIGAAFGAVVTSLTKNLLTPLIAIPGNQDFSSLDFTINESTFGYGVFLNDVISFVLIAAAVFFAVVRPMNTLAQRRKRGEEEAIAATPTPSDEALLLTEIRDLIANARGS
ncbi:MAG: large conductance mechanosensitive channel protein MscL [Acidimicrobiia bacterium]